MTQLSALADDVRAAARGDQRSWDRLVREMSPAIRAVARRHRLAPCDQDEVAQRTWLAFVRHIEQIKEPAAAGGWLVTTATRESLRLVREAARTVPLADIEAFEPASTHGSEAEDFERAAAERLVAVRDALDSMPERQRALLDALMIEPALTY